MSKTKILNLLLLLSSLLVYLEWGEDQHMFLIQGEIDVLGMLTENPWSVVHPFVLLPLVGQLLLLITLLQNPPSQILSWLGLAGLITLVAMVAFVGVISSNLKIVLSTLPFLVVAGLQIRHLWRHRFWKPTA